MSNPMFDYVKKLYVNHLYSDVIHIIRFYDTGINRIKEIFGVVDGLKVTCYYASSLYHTKEYKIALQMFENALTFYSDHFAIFQKNLNNNDSKRKGLSHNEEDANPFFCSSIEIKYLMHLCYKELGQINCAIHTLQSIPSECSSLKILISLGDLYMVTNNSKEALTCYINAVLTNPLALYHLKKVLNYSNSSMANEFVKLVNKKISEEFPLYSCQLNKLINAYHLAQTPKTFKKAYHLFHELSTAKCTNIKEMSVNLSTYFNVHKIENNSDNIYMRLETAKFLYFDGYVSNAIDIYEDIYLINPGLLEGVDCYAACLYRDTKFKELEKLTSHVLSMCSSIDSVSMIPLKISEKSIMNEFASNLIFTRVEPWIVLGYYNLTINTNKSILFANKALQIDNDNEEALILKTFFYQKSAKSGCLKNYKEYLNELEQFIFKNKYDKNYVRFEIIRYLAESLLLNEGREVAENYVKEFLKKFGMTPRIYTFYAKLILMDTNASSLDKKKAVKYLEKALNMNPYYLNAVVHLSKFYIEKEKPEFALNILLKATDKFDYQFLHKLIYECYMKLHKEDKALMHQALSCIKKPLDYHGIEEDALNEYTLSLDLKICTNNTSNDINEIGSDILNESSVEDEVEMDDNNLDIWN